VDLISDDWVRKLRSSDWRDALSKSWNWGEASQSDAFAFGMSSIIDDSVKFLSNFFHTGIVSSPI